MIAGIAPAALQPAPVLPGTDLAAVDATCCRIMGMDPTKLGYLNLAMAAAPWNTIAELQEPVSAVRTDFRLLSQFDHVRLRP